MRKHARPQDRPAPEKERHVNVKKEENIDILREEVQALRKQVEHLAKVAEEKASHCAASANATCLEDEVEKYQQLAAEKLQKALAAGGDGVENLSQRIRQNPLGSLLLAFGAGCALSLLFRHGK